MSEDLALRIPLQGDTSGIEAAMNTMKSKVSGAMGGVKDAMGAVGIMAAGFLEGAINSASKAAASTDQLKIKLENQGVAWGTAKGEVDKFTSGVKAMSTFTGGDAKAALDNLITRHVSLKDALRDQTGMTELAVAKNMSLADASNILADAENGKMKGLQKLGLVTAEEIKNGISMDEINKRLNSSYKGLSEGQMKTLPGQIQLMSRNFGEFKTGIGTALLPVITMVASALEKITENLKKIDAPTKQVIAVVLALTTALGLLVGGAGIAQKVLGILGPVASGLGTTIGAMILPILAVIAVIAALTLAYTKNFGGFKTFVDGIFKDIMSIFNAFKLAISGGDVGEELSHSFGKNTGQIKVIIQGIVDAVKVFVAILSGNFKSASSLVDEWGEDTDETMGNVVRAVSKVALTIREVITNVVTLVKSNMPQIKATIGTVISGIVVIFNTILVPAFKIVMGIISTLVSWVVDHWPEIQKVIQAAITVILAIFNNVLVPALKFVMSIFSQVIGWISDNWPLISKTITTVLNVVWGVIKSVLGSIQSFWNTWGKTIMDYVSMVFNNIKIVITTIIHVVEDIIKAVMQAINGDWSGAWHSLVQAVKDIFGGLGAIISNVLSGIGKIFGDLANIAIGWGSNMIDGFIKGITGGITKVKNAVGDVMKGVKGFLGFNSPSKEGEGQHITEWGENMISGFMGGIKNKLPDMQKLMNTAIKAPTLSANVDMGVSGVGGSSNSGNTSNSNIVNFNGSYAFADKGSITTFMNQAALLIQRRKA